MNAFTLRRSFGNLDQRNTLCYLMDSGFLITETAAETSRSACHGLGLNESRSYANCSISMLAGTFAGTFWESCHRKNAESS